MKLTELSKSDNSFITRIQANLPGYAIKITKNIQSNSRRIEVSYLEPNRTIIIKYQDITDNFLSPANYTQIIEKLVREIALEIIK